MPEYKTDLEREIQFLVFWGRLGRETVIKMPRWKRKMWIEMTSQSLKTLYGSGD